MLEQLKVSSVTVYMYTKQFKIFEGQIFYILTKFSSETVKIFMVELPICMYVRE